jgi:hypothetical protein
MVLNGLDDIWRQANGWVNEMPDAIIAEHGPRLAELFTIHGMTMKSEIEKRLPEGAERPLAMIDEAFDYIKQNDLREALRNLALGIIAIAPPSEWSMDPAFEDLFNRADDKSIALIESVDQNGVGIMPFTLRMIFQSGGQDVKSFYQENLQWVFPKPQTVTVVGP